MKVYINKYRYHWVSPYKICELVCFWREIDYDEPWVKRVNKVLEPVCTLWMKFLDVVHPKVNYVKIDYWDTWSMDSTLSPIILPMLKQLKETKHGAPFTDDKDVPKELKSTSAPPKENEWDTDSLWHMRWDWVLVEMIWAFEQKVKDDAEGQFFDHSAYKDSKRGTNEWLDDMTNAVSRVKYDKEGHKTWQDRKSNGFRLFGRYFENLWD